MGLLKTLLSNNFYSFLRHQNTPLPLQEPPNSFRDFQICVSRVFSSYTHRRSLSGTVQFVSTNVAEEQTEIKSTHSKNSESTDRSDLIVLKAFKEFSPEIVLLVNHLYDNGYFSQANFLTSGKLDLNCFSTIYARDFIRAAAQKFGKDHPEILKRLSLCDVERIARFGCPSVERKTAFAAKRLRTFFSIQENIICQPCKLRSSCKVVNLPVRRRKKVMITDKLSLVDIMRVLTLYGLELIPRQLVIPHEVKDSIRKLLIEVVNNSQVNQEEKVDAPEQDEVKKTLERKPLKELSPDMVLLASHLHEEGYLKNANFLAPEKLDLSCFSSYHSRDFFRCAAERFGQHHKEIMKSMLFSDLKTVVRFGCPSIEKKTTIAAKKLRSFFCIQEATVCQTCQLKNSCPVMNQRVRKYQVTYISFPDIMRVLTTYGLELVPEELVIPAEIKETVSKLLGVVVNPGQVTQDDQNSGASGV